MRNRYNFTIFPLLISCSSCASSVTTEHQSAYVARYGYASGCQPRWSITEYRFTWAFLLPWGVLKAIATKAEWKQKLNIFLWQGKDCNWWRARHRRKARWSLERDKQKWRGKNAKAKTLNCITRTTSPPAAKKISYRHTKNITKADNPRKKTYYHNPRHDDN